MRQAQRRENSRQKQVTQYITASLLSIIPHQEEMFFPLHNFLSGSATFLQN